MAAALTIGGISFQDFEIPEQVHLGGAHMGTLHKLPGGERVFDAAGADDHPIGWSGRFQGGNAVGRAQALDAMRIGGSLQALCVAGLFRQVVVHDFKFVIEKPYQVLYTIECLVISNPASAMSNLFSDLDSILSGDLSYIAAATVTDVSSFVTSFTGVAFNTLAPSAISVLANTAGTFAGSLGTMIASNDASLGTSDLSGPLDAAKAVAMLNAQTGLATNQEELCTLQDYVQRVGVNLATKAS